MKVFSGTSVLPGVAIGPLQVVETAGQAVEKKTVVDPGAEVERYEEAKAHAMEELKGLYELAVGKAGEENAAIFDIHQMLLDDSDFNEAVISTIMDQKVNAEYAVKTQGKAFARLVHGAGRRIYECPGNGYDRRVGPGGAVSARQCHTAGPGPGRSGHHSG
jgi:phosphotransferase system enzyme I (PtsI)